LVKYFLENKFVQREEAMEEKIQVGDVIKMKKQHPCGTNEWEIIRVGMDFRLKCIGCNRQVMVPRKLVEKNFRGFLKRADNEMNGE
jgi:hypothetical protein